MFTIGDCSLCTGAYSQKERIKVCNLPPVELVLSADLYAVDDQDTAFGTGICFAKISDGDRHFFKDVVSVHPE